MFKKYDQILIISTLILFIGFILVVLIYYMQNTSKLEQKSYDSNTITAADFTVEFDITQKMWDDFETEWESKYKADGYSKARAFKKELKHDVEREI